MLHFCFYNYLTRVHTKSFPIILQAPFAGLVALNQPPSGIPLHLTLGVASVAPLHPMMTPTPIQQKTPTMFLVVVGDLSWRSVRRFGVWSWVRKGGSVGVVRGVGIVGVLSWRSTSGSVRGIGVWKCWGS